MSEEEKKAIEDDILFDIDMQLYDEFNDKIATMNDHLGDIYSLRDIEEVEQAEKDKKIQLLTEAIRKQQKEIEEWRNGIRINDKVSVPKDIIRAKIQIYKDKKADSIGMLINYEIWKAKIEILQELLGDDKNE